MNITSRLQDATKEGCITLSLSVYEDIKYKPEIKTEFMEEKSFNPGYVLELRDEPLKCNKTATYGDEA